jgi:hypothetical protein
MAWTNTPFYFSAASLAMKEKFYEIVTEKSISFSRKKTPALSFPEPAVIKLSSPVNYTWL